MSSKHWGDDFFLTQGLREDMSTDIEQWMEGGIGAPRFAARQVGNAGKIAGNLMGVPVGMLFGALPQAAQVKIAQGIQAAKEGAMDVPGVKEIVQYVNSNPVLKRDVEALWDAGDLLALSAGKKAVGAVGDNIRTHFPKFYDPKPHKRVAGKVEEAAVSTKAAAKGAVSPQARANKEVTGLDVGRVRELVDEKDAQYLKGSEVNNALYDIQKGRETLASRTPTAKAEIIGHADIGDAVGVKGILKGSQGAPDEVVESAYKSVSNSARVSGKEKTLSELTNRGDPGTVVIGRSDTTSGTRLPSEIRGLGLDRNQTALTRSLNDGYLNEFRQLGLSDDAVRGYLGKSGPIDDADRLEVFLHQQAIFDTPRWRGKGEGRVMNPAPRGASLKDKAKRAVEGVQTQGLQKQAPPGHSGMRMDRTQLLRAWYAVKGGKTKIKDAQYGKMRPLKDKDYLAAKWVDDQMAKRMGNVRRDDNGLVVAGQTYMSQYKEMANVGQRYFFDPKNLDEAWSTVMDGNDLFGVVGPGMKRGLSVYPMQKIATTGKAAQKATMPTRSKAATTKVMEDAAVDIEKATGVPRLRGPKGGPLESPEQYSRRALTEYQAPVQARHRAQAARAGLLTGLALQDSDE